MILKRRPTPTHFKSKAPSTFNSNPTSSLQSQIDNPMKSTFLTTLLLGLGLTVEGGPITSFELHVNSKFPVVTFDKTNGGIILPKDLPSGLYSVPLDPTAYSNPLRHVYPTLIRPLEMDASNIKTAERFIVARQILGEPPLPEGCWYVGDKIHCTNTGLSRLIGAKRGVDTSNIETAERSIVARQRLGDTRALPTGCWYVEINKISCGKITPKGAFKRSEHVEAQREADRYLPCKLKPKSKNCIIDPPNGRPGNYNPILERSEHVDAPEFTLFQCPSRDDDSKVSTRAIIDEQTMFVWEKRAVEPMTAVILHVKGASAYFCNMSKKDVKASSGEDYLDAAAGTGEVCGKDGVFAMANLNDETQYGLELAGNVVCKPLEKWYDSE